MFQATRRRLAIWYTIVTAVLLLVFATGVYVYVRATLIDRIDDTLKHVIEVVERSLVISPNPNPAALPQHINIEATFRDNSTTIEDDHIDLEWFSPTGDLLWSTFKGPTDIEIFPNRAGQTVQLAGGQRIRQITQAIETDRQVLGYLRVSHPWFEVTKPSRELLTDLAIGITLMISSVAASGWLLSGLAIEPVRASYQRLKQFTADASHELRNPIATIQTNVQVALSDPKLDNANRQQWQIIERISRRLGKLVDDLLFLARQDSAIIHQNWIEIPLDALLMEVIEEQQLHAKEKNIHLSLDILDPPATLLSKIDEHCLNPYTTEGEWSQLSRLFTNLLNNAVKYTPNEGKIQVELKTIARYNHLSLQIQIKDTGIGIPEEALPHLFDRFYRAKQQSLQESNPTGSGLGLAIVGAIVQSHQGEIQIQSKLKQGTTVTVILPGLKLNEKRLS